MDKAAARKAKFAALVKTPGLVSRGDRVLSQAEQIELFELMKTSPTPHSIRSLREAVVSTGPSDFARQVFEYVIKYAIESDQITTLQSALSYLLHTVHPKYPLTDPSYYSSLYLISLSFKDLDEASQQLSGRSDEANLVAYLQAISSKDIAKWIAVLYLETDDLRRKLMLRQKNMFFAQAELLSHSYKQNQSWIEELLRQKLTDLESLRTSNQ